MKDVIEQLTKLSKVGFGYDIKTEDRKALEAAVLALSASPAGVGVETPPPSTHVRVTGAMVNAADSVLSRRRPGIPDETIRLAIAAALDAADRTRTPSPQPRASVPASLKGDEQ